MPRFVINAQAERDLREQWKYIARESGSNSLANAFLDAITHKLELLARQPSMGRPRDEFGPGLRSFPAEGHILFYYPLEDGIEVVRVIHGRRDIGAMFEGEEPEDE